MDSGIVARTAEVFENLIIRFVPGRGVIADSFPLRIAVAPEMLVQARTHPGVISVAGNGGIGSRLTFTLMNGEAVYEVTDYAYAGAFKLLVAERRSFKFRLAGKEAEIKRFGLMDLNRLADEWPAVVALKEDVLAPPVELKSVIRVRNRDKNPQVRFSIGGTRSTYNVVFKHQMPDGDVVYIAERDRLQNSEGIVVRLPTAAAVGRTGMRIIS